MTEGTSKESLMFLNAVQTFLNSLGHSMRMPPMLLVTCPDHHTRDVMQDWGRQCFERNVQTRIRAHAHASTARPGKATDLREAYQAPRLCALLLVAVFHDFGNAVPILRQRVIDHLHGFDRRPQSIE